MDSKTTYFPLLTTLSTGGRVLDLSTPRIMGILNVTPDSFYDGGRHHRLDAAVFHANSMLNDGADIIDIGGMSSRPGATIISPQEEMDRILPVIIQLKHEFPQAILSIDTLHGRTALEAIRCGADIINDISGGTYDTAMADIIATHQLPMVVMHMQGEPGTMQLNPQYNDVVEEVLQYFRERIQTLMQQGIRQLIVDPGFGFGKALHHNYLLGAHLDRFRALGMPLMAGISRKSMVTKVIGTRPENALNGSTAMHMYLLVKGVQILRVHDVREAWETIRIYREFAMAAADA